MTESYTLKEGLVDHERRIKLLENGLRTGNLAYSSVENGTIPFYDSSGQPRIFMGKQNDGTFAITYGNGPKPPPPSKPAVTAIQLGFVIGWDGTFTGGVDRPADVVRVDVHMSETANFKPDGSTVIGSIFDEGAVSVNADVTAKEFLLVAVTSGDVPSDPSARVTKTALPAGQLAAGSVKADTIAAGAISADKLAANLILGTKIIGGSATNGRVEMSQLGLQSFAENGLKSWEVNTNGHMFFYDTRNSVTANTPTIRVLATGEMEFVNNNTGRTTMQFSSDGQFRVFNPSGAKMMHINNQGLLEIFAPDTGARTFGIKSDGQVYAGKADGTATFVIDKTGQVLVTGRIRTAVTGDRMELLPSWASNTNGQLSFISRSDEAAYFWSSSFMDTDGKYKPTVMMMTPPRADNWYMVTKWGGGNKEIFAIVAQNTKLNWAYGQTVPRARIVINDLFVHISAGTNPGEPGYVQGNWSSNLYLQSEGNPFIDKNCAPMLYAMYQPSGSSTNWYCGIVFDSRAERAAVVYQNSGVQARTWAGDAWTPFAGAQYINLSAVETKTDIDELPDPGLEVIRQAPASRWRYKRRASDDYLHGPMADDLPSWLTISAPAEYKHMPGEQDDVLLVPPEPNAALDNASMIGVLWDAIRDLDIEFDTMRRQLGIEIPERKYDHEPVERSAEFSEFYTIDEVPTNG